MKTLVTVVLFSISAFLFAVGQPLPPGVTAFPLMTGPYCFTGETSVADNEEDIANGFILAEILFTQNGFKISIPVEKAYPLYPVCPGNRVEI